MDISSKQVILCVTGLGLAGMAFWYDHAARAVSECQSSRGAGRSLTAETRWSTLAQESDDPRDARIGGPTSAS